MKKSDVNKSWKQFHYHNLETQNMIKIDTVVAVFCLFAVYYPICYGANTYYVSSEPSVQCLTLNISNDSDHSCKTFTEYATAPTMRLDSKNQDIVMSFLQGVHNLSRNFTINQNLTMKGQPVSDPKENFPQILLVLHQGDIIIQNAARFNMSNLSIDGLSSSTISLKEVLDVFIENVVIVGSALLIQCVHCNRITALDNLFIGSVLVIAWPDPYQNTQYNAYNEVLIRDTVLHLSPVGNGISCCNVRSINIVNVLLSNILHTFIAHPPEAGLITFCACYPWGVQFREDCDLISSGFHYLDIYNSTFKRNSGTGLCIKVPVNAAVIVRSSAILDHEKGGAMFTCGQYGTRVILRNNNISNNINTLRGSIKASALKIYTIEIVDSPPHTIPELYLIQCQFVGNRHLGNTLITTVSIASHIRAYVTDSDFVDNYGSAITAYTRHMAHWIMF